MIVIEHDRVELDHCAACGGTWFDAGELALLFEGEAAPWLGAEAIAALPAASSRERRRRCPLCRARMRKIELGPDRQVLVDACPRGDGLWFDDREVAELARGLLATTGGLPRRVAAFLGESLGGEPRRRKDGEG